DVGAADGDGDDLGAGGVGGAAGLVQVLELAGAGQQARLIGNAGDHQRVICDVGGVFAHSAIIAPRAGRRLRSKHATRATLLPEPTNSPPAERVHDLDLVPVGQGMRL